MATAQDRINMYLTEATSVGLQEVERLARKALREKPELEEFIMAMGTAFFSYKEVPEPPKGCSDEVWDAYSKTKELPRTEEVCTELDEFIMENDSTLKLTGEPMRFTANGPKVTEW